MWLDLERLGAVGDGGTLAFGFPRQGPPEWRLNWQAVVHQVAVTPDIDAKEALLDDFASGVGVRTLGFVNAHAMNSAVTDPGFAADLLDLDYLVRDGIGVHTLYRMIGAHSGLNLNGTDLLPELIARFAGRRIALFGTQLHLVDRVAEKLRRDHGCDVITADGFQPDGYYLKRVAQARPELVVLGMGMPKQERVARQLKHGLRQDVAIVCGGAILDFLSGHKPRAPFWMRKCGLEWAFRLSLEPKRLFGRYVLGNPLFLLRSAILAVWPKPSTRKARTLPERRPSAEAFGIGGPAAALTPRAEPRSVLAPTPLSASVPLLLPVKPAAASAVSVFSANRPVVARNDLYGRQADLDRLLGWVLDQSGNALIYGPRGYGKTSLVRVFGEIADSRQHVVLYASGSRDIGFDALMRSYLGELAENGLVPAVDAATGLNVQGVATRLAGITDASVVLIIDEFDRIEREDTRHSLIELVKDVSDLTASVRFVLVGVATDATAILGYHPSVQRCITCVALARLAPGAIEELFTRKAAADGLQIGAAEVRTVVGLTAGSAYHAQLIGQKLVAQARRNGRQMIDTQDLDRVIDDILSDAVLMDDGFARNARAMRDPTARSRLLQLARMALTGPDDIIDVSNDPAATTLQPLCADLVADGVLRPVDSMRVPHGYRFTNAFLPQFLLMIEHRAIGQQAVSG